MEGSRGTPPLSPCRQICQLGPDDVCTGCGRTIDEITRWISMSDTEKLAIIKRLANRVPALDDEDEG